MGKTSPDISAQRFGSWSVLHRDGYIYGKQAAWVCRCDCGTIRRLGGSNLRRGGTLGCGCENHAALGDRARKHGKRAHHLYETWTSMRARCMNPNHHAYARYGGRGISVCLGWAAFDAFLADMEPSWRNSLTLNRIDNDGPYSPANCEWATDKRQAQNRGSTLMVEFRGETRTLSDWAEIVGIKHTVIQMRLWRGWSVDRAMSEPPRGPHFTRP